MSIVFKTNLKYLSTCNIMVQETLDVMCASLQHFNIIKVCVNWF